MLDNDDVFNDTLRQGYRYLRRRDHSVFELKTKLLSKGNPGQAIGRVIEEFKRNGYLDDVEFARGFTRHCQIIRRLGPLRIRAGLLKKGVSQADIDKAMEEKYSFDVEAENLDRLIRQKVETGEPEEKIMRFLQGKGYPIEKVYVRMKRIPE